MSARLIAPLLRHTPLLAGLVMLVSAGCQTCKVVRIGGGRAFCEREIEPAAYAAYARGQLAESAGDLQGALLEYERVTNLDSQAADAWVRIGAVRCRSNPKAAESAWTRAGELAPDSARLWFERARCALGHGELAQADTFARTALQISPSKTEITLLSARIASRRGEPEREATLLFGALAADPTNAALWVTVMTSPTLPIAYREYATRRLLGLRPLGDDWVPPAYRSMPAPGASQQQIEEHLRRQFSLALSSNDSKAALRISGLLGLSPNEVALAALLAGFDALAAQQANLILTLDPNDATAWLIALLAADLSLSTERYEELLARPPARPAALEPALTAELSDLIARRTGTAPHSAPPEANRPKPSPQH